MSTISISVLMTCHNRKQTTLKCLDQLFSITLPNNAMMEVFLVDDASSDGTADAIRLNHPKVRIIQGTGELFWNRGMHLAWKTASEAGSPDFYLLLNDDTLLFPTAIQDLVDAAESTNRLSIICGATCSPTTPTKVSYGGHSASSFTIPPNGTLQKCDYFNGNCVLVPKSVFETLGNLDPAYHHSLGDFDYGVRAQKSGITSYVAPNFVGTCANHERPPKWRSSEIPLAARLRALYSPLGCNPFEFFRFDRRQNGVVKSILHFITLHLRAIAPDFWRQTPQP